jgi:hypothetical protein
MADVIVLDHITLCQCRTTDAKKEVLKHINFIVSCYQVYNKQQNQNFEAWILSKYNRKI